MDLLVNDLSIHRQFHTISAFREALARLMSMRNTARRFGREVYCHRAFLTASPMPKVSMQQAIGRLSVENERRAAMVWLTHGGPFWDDLRQHGADDWLEYRGDIVTDTAVGEAAFRTLHGVDCGLVSAMPSEWNCSPVEVIWRLVAGDSEDKTAVLENWRDAITLEEYLRDAPEPIHSWDNLRVASVNRFENLIFHRNCFEPLDGMPFSRSSADRILVLLDVLDRFAHAFDANGARTPTRTADLPGLLHGRRKTHGFPTRRTRKRAASETN